MGNGDSILKKDWVGFFIISGVIFLTLLPATHTDYAHHDDYQVFDYSPDEDKAPILFDRLVRLGRPITAYLFKFQNYLIDNQIERAHFFRFAGMTCLVVSAFCVFQLMKRRSCNEADSLLLVLGMFVMPSFVLGVSYFSNFCSLISYLPTVLSFFLGMAASSKLQPTSHRLGLALLSFGMMTVALLTYPASTMFYWVLLALLVVTLEWESWRKWRFRVYFLLGIGLVSMGVFRLYLLWSVSRFGDVNIDNYSVNLAVDLQQRWYFFVHELLFRALNLWNIYPTKVFAIGTAGIIFAGIILEVVKGFRDKPEEVSTGSLAIFLSQKIFGLAGLFLLSIAPTLVSNYNLATYRTLGPLLSMVCVALFWSLGNILKFAPKATSPRIKTGILAVFCVISIHQANQNITLQAFSDTVEYRFIKANLQQNRQSLRSFKNIHVAYGNYLALTTADPPIVDEFFFPTSRHGNARFMVIGALKELGFDRIRDTWKITVGSKADFQPDESILEIDFSEIENFY